MTDGMQRLALGKAQRHLRRMLPRLQAGPDTDARPVPTAEQSEPALYVHGLAGGEEGKAERAAQSMVPRRLDHPLGVRSKGGVCSARRPMGVGNVIVRITVIWLDVGR